MTFLAPQTETTYLHPASEQAGQASKTQQTRGAVRQAKRDGTSRELSTRPSVNAERAQSTNRKDKRRERAPHNGVHKNTADTTRGYHGTQTGTVITRTPTHSAVVNTAYKSRHGVEYL